MADAKILIIDHEKTVKILTRIAYQILENNLEEKELIIAGIQGRGFSVASMLATKLGEISSLKVTLHQLKLDKDQPKSDEITMEPDTKVKGKTVVIVDDVLNSGRTLIYSFIPFLTHGVKNIQTAVLIDRNHKCFPVAADYVGISLATTSREHVNVVINDKGQVSAYLN
jgi:pyrimidine operon attenuation protein/uracil phosphoribosyltransferase